MAKKSSSTPPGVAGKSNRRRNDDTPTRNEARPSPAWISQARPGTHHGTDAYRKGEESGGDKA